MKIHASVQKKMVVAIIAAAMFFGIATIIILIRIGEQSITQSAKRSIESILVQQGMLAEEAFLDAMLLAQHIASQDKIVSYLQQENPPIQKPELLAYLRLFDSDNRYQSIYVMDTTGKTLLSTDVTFVGQNYNFRDYFKKALAGEPAIDSAIGATTGKFGYFFSYPIKEVTGNIIGVAVAKLKEAPIKTTLKPGILSTSGALMLVDKYGVIVQSNKPELLFKSLGVITPEAMSEIDATKRFGDLTISSLHYDELGLDIKQVGEMRSVELYDTTLHKRDEIIGITQIKNTSFFVMIEESRLHSAQIVWPIVQKGGTYIFGAVLIAMSMLLFFVGRILGPLRELKNGSFRIKGGDIEGPIEIKSGDEFEDIGSVFNELTEKIKNIYGNVEEKIWERAADFEKFKLAVENVSDHIIITDIDGRILYANKAAEEITGYSRNEMVGNHPSLWGKKMSSEFYARMWDIIKNQKKTFHGELTNMRKTGETYIAEVHITPLIMDKSLLYGFVGIEHDITVQKEIDRAKTEFVSIASHQLRTPLAVINWYIEMLTKEEVGVINGEQRKYLNQVYLASRRMVDLVNSLLSVSRIDMGAFHVEPELIALSAAADSVLDELRHLSDVKQIQIIKEYDTTLPLINTDPSLMRIVFQNLLSNAIKYTPEKGVVTIALKKEGNKNAVITITDTGYGIPKNQQSKIFDKFFRADNAREKEPDGNGLGLYIVKAIIDHAGGVMSFSSQEGKGTEFVVSLPLAGMKKNEVLKSLAV